MTRRPIDKGQTPGEQRANFACINFMRKE